MKSYGWQDSYSTYEGNAYLTNAVKILIIVNVAVFVLLHLFPAFSWFLLFGLVPKYVFAKGMIWQLVTHLFLHEGLWHLIINMLMLLFFGPNIERAWGSRNFLSYYFLTGIGAGLCAFALTFNSLMPVLGASGAIFALLVAYAFLFPESVILVLFIFPMKIRHAVFVFAVINLLAALSSPGNAAAYLGQLAGGFFGYLYIKSEMLQRLFNPKAILEYYSSVKEKKKRKEKEELSRQTDEILDKISKSGLKSLTEKEKKILNRKSRMD